MFKLCFQALLLVASIVGLVLCFREQRNYAAQSVAKTQSAERIVRVAPPMAAVSPPPMAKVAAESYSTTTSAATGDHVEAVTDAEAERIAALIANAIESRDPEAFLAQFDLDGFRTLALAWLPGNSVGAEGLRTRFSDIVHPIFLKMLGEVVREASSACGSYRYLRTIHREEGPRVIFRLIKSDETLNYHEFVLGKKGKEVYAVDLFVYASGERLSESLRGVFMAAMPRDLEGELARSAPSIETVRRFTAYAEISDLFKGGEYERALAAYARMPPDLRCEKVVQLIRVMSAQKVSDAEYLRALDEYRQTFSTDPSIDLISIDAHFAAGRFVELDACLKRLNVQVGGDSHLQLLRANVFIHQGKHAEAETVASELLAVNPRSVDAYWVLVAVSLEEKRFDKTGYFLARLRDELDVRIGDLTQAPQFAEFVASPAFESWQSIRR